MNFAVAGDIALHGLISDEPDLNGRRFGWLESELSRYSGTVANLEVPVRGEEKNSAKKAHLFSDPDITNEILRRLKIVCVSLANNHILDCGREGLRNTIALLDKAGIHYTGAGFNSGHIKPAVFSIEGVRIGFAAYADPSTHPGTEAFNDIYFNTFDITRVIDDLNSVRDKVDLYIISLHWGKDYSLYPEEWQVATARKLSDSGADIIMGHHSHTLQAFETYGSGKIFYGVGSLVFGDFIKNGQKYALFRKTKNSAIFVLDDKCKLIDAIPTHELKGNTVIRGKAKILKRNGRLHTIIRIRSKSRLINSLVRFNEDVLYRVYEYFFGYYMSPFRRLLQVSNIRKIKRLFS
jgi:poly-gamma-glutamate synthesis protein (capsule biosynthesis protein)